MVERSFTSTKTCKSRSRIERWERWIHYLRWQRFLSLFQCACLVCNLLSYFYLCRHMQIVFVFQAHISACKRAKREREKEMCLDLYSRSRAPTIVRLLMRFWNLHTTQLNEEIRPEQGWETRTHFQTFVRMHAPMGTNAAKRCAFWLFASL